jgi:hypothetical protein
LEWLGQTRYKPAGFYPTIASTLSRLLMIRNAARRVVFIASLGHSGSTLLDLMLGGHPQFIGLGEIANVIAPSERADGRSANPFCSCGETSDRCPFWSVVTERLANEQPSSIARRYEVVFETFESIFGTEVFPVDSSKYLPRLEILHEQLQLDLRVLFLLKDVRAFTVSELDNIARKRAVGVARRSTNSLAVFRNWYSTNTKLGDYLEREQIPTFMLGYEELCLAAEKMARKICEFLQVPFCSSMLTLSESRSHVIRGNRMRNQSDKSALAYDHRWFRRHVWMLPALLCPRIMRYNRQHVYSNGLDSMWEQ